MKRLIPVLLVAAALRLVLPVGAFLFTDRPWEHVCVLDCPSYTAPGQNLAESFTFAHHGVVELFRLPGYPLLLALASLTGHLAMTAILIQVALGVMTVALVYRIAACAGDTRLALTAAWIAASEPQLVMYCGVIASETLFTALLAGALFLWQRSDISRLRYAALVGALTSAAAMVRPVGYFVPLVYVVGALARPDVTWWARARVGATIAAVAVVVLGGWHMRNGLVADSWVFSSQVGRQPYLTAAAALTAKAEGRPFEAVRADFIADVRDATSADDSSSGPFAEEVRRRGRQFVRSHPLAVLRLQLIGSLRVLLQPTGTEAIAFFDLYGEHHAMLGEYATSHSPAQTWAIIKTEGPRVLALLTFTSAYWCLFLIAAVLGAIRLRHLPVVRQQLGLTTLLVSVYLVLTSGGFWGNARFRHPLMPVLCIIAAAGVVWLRDRTWRPPSSEAPLQPPRLPSW